MGFLQPNLPQVDVAEWRRGTRNERMRPMVRHLLEVGFGTPDVVYVLYLVKIALYVLGAMLFALSTPGIDGFTSIGDWWAEPIVFQKLVFWTVLFEVLGLGCGFGPLNLRFLPPLGSFLYWLRPGTIRLPPWPARVPLTRGDRRTVADALLYAALLATLVIALLSASDPGSSTSALPVWKVLLFLGVLAVISLRDRTIFLAARSEVYAAIALTFLFSAPDAIVGAKLVMLVIWWGAALSKINGHFPFVVQAMETNSPIWRSKKIKHLFSRSFPDDLRPSRLSAALAHGGTIVEFGVPLVLICSGGGTLTTVAAIVMIAFHLHIIATIPMGVPLEWNVFMIFAILILFVDKASIGLGDLERPWVLLVPLLSASFVVLGSLFPEKISFLVGMRYYAGNWDTSVWCFTQAGLAKFDSGTTKATMLPHQQLEKIYGPEEAEVPLFTGYAFRSIHTHGRAHFALIPRLCGEDHENYLVMDGELIAGVVLGWNFGDGHLHREQLIAALQERCAFEPGEVRILTLDAQPIHKPTQAYRLIDAATGEFERGTVLVADMVVRQPWDTDLPITMTSTPGGELRSS
ncbi:membrane protein [Nocardioides szechwanensis]|uniref:DUF3556 domain-containing protein n=1 Tax=Nocardioides szechwanensis TaxID=1005944 RepID=A0A1H0J5Z9_9ACTN|nr:DUF3556 domain-containing protein [Nocardioides szechwanensis]GEP35013.1 membrane protein [Nocardioides szechwanensis]SDO38900.1 Transmembrane protein of unknown function [Nocardioides szechwanensis]